MQWVATRTKDESPLGAPQVMILHADLDAFFPSVEQLLHPELRGQPVVVGSGCIASCSREARGFGLRTGMRMSRARRLCPHAHILPGHATTYAAYARRFFSLCRELAPDIETHLDDAYVDMSGTERIWPDPLDAGKRLRRRVRDEIGLVVTVGIGPNRLLARLAGKRAKPDGISLLSAVEAETYLPRLPAEELPGIGPRTLDLLSGLGIRTIGDLRRVPMSTLRALVGNRAVLLHHRALGIDTPWVEPLEIPKTISRESSFFRDTADPTEIDAMLAYLTERAARAARSFGIAPASVGVHARYTRGSGPSATMRLSEADSRDDILLAAVRTLLPRVWKERNSLHSVGVTLGRFRPSADRQIDLFDTDTTAPKRRRLYRCLDEIRTRFGHSAIIAGASISLLSQIKRDRFGFRLRTSSLTK